MCISENQSNLRLSKYKESSMNIKFDYWKCIRMYEKAQLRSNFRKEISPWLGLEPQIREQILVGTYLWYEKSILGWFGQPGLYLKKKFEANYEQLLRLVFLSFHGQKIDFKFVKFVKNIVTFALKSCIEKRLKKSK